MANEKLNSVVGELIERFDALEKLVSRLPGIQMLLQQDAREAAAKRDAEMLALPTAEKYAALIARPDLGAFLQGLGPRAVELCIEAPEHLRDRLTAQLLGPQQERVRLHFEPKPNFVWVQPKPGHTVSYGDVDITREQAEMLSDAGLGDDVSDWLVPDGKRGKRMYRYSPPSFSSIRQRMTAEVVSAIRSVVPRIDADVNSGVLIVTPHSPEEIDQAVLDAWHDEETRRTTSGAYQSPHWDPRW